jgi:hypothetical protein
VVFTDESKRIYDVGELINEIPSFQAFLTDIDLFNRAKPVAKGAGIVWNDDLDLASDEIFENGKPVPLSPPHTSPCHPSA